MNLEVIPPLRRFKNWCSGSPSFDAKTANSKNKTCVSCHSAVLSKRRKVGARQGFGKKPVWPYISVVHTGWIRGRACLARPKRILEDTARRVVRNCFLFAVVGYKPSNAYAVVSKVCCPSELCSFVANRVRRLSEHAKFTWKATSTLPRYWTFVSTICNQ